MNDKKMIENKKSIKNIIMEQIRNILYNKIVIEITAILTIGREDDGMCRFNRDEVQSYLEQNNLIIAGIIEDIIADYEYGEIRNMENDWVREYMGELNFNI